MAPVAEGVMKNGGNDVLTRTNRHFVQDPGIVRHGIHRTLPGPVLRMGVPLQLHDEGLLHRE